MQVNSDSSSDKPEATLEGKVAAQKDLVEKPKVQWKLLWSERYNDKIKAEDVSINDYEILDVQKGTIIHATRDFKAVNFRDILHEHLVENPDRYVQPKAQEGGWNKFVKKPSPKTPHKHTNAPKLTSPKNVRRSNPRKADAAGST